MTESNHPPMQQTLQKILQTADERDLPCLLVGGNAVILAIPALLRHGGSCAV